MNSDNASVAQWATPLFVGAIALIACLGELQYHGLVEVAQYIHLVAALVLVGLGLQRLFRFLRRTS